MQGASWHTKRMPGRCGGWLCPAQPTLPMPTDIPMVAPPALPIPTPQVPMPDTVPAVQVLQRGAKHRLQGQPHFSIPITSPVLQPYHEDAEFADSPLHVASNPQHRCWLSISRWRHARRGHPDVWVLLPALAAYGSAVPGHCWPGFSLMGRFLGGGHPAKPTDRAVGRQSALAEWARGQCKLLLKPTLGSKDGDDCSCNVSPARTCACVLAKQTYQVRACRVQCKDSGGASLKAE
jgi:hypothetical protein